MTTPKCECLLFLLLLYLQPPSLHHPRDAFEILGERLMYLSVGTRLTFWKRELDRDYQHFRAVLTLVK